MTTKPELENVSKEIESIVLGYGFVWTHGTKHKNYYKHDSGTVCISNGGISFSCANYKYSPRSVYARGTYVLTEAEAKSIENKLKMMKKKTQESKAKEDEEFYLANKECERIKNELTDIMENIAMGNPFEVNTEVRGILKKYVYVEVVYQGHTLDVVDTEEYLVRVCVNEDICKEVPLKKAFQILDLLFG